MAKALNLAVVLTIALVATTLQQTTVAQKLHVVGDRLGWIVPPGGPIAYSTWADLQTFTVGDILSNYIYTYKYICAYICFCLKKHRELNVQFKYN